jgi:hypothetical protein
MSPVGIESDLLIEGRYALSMAIWGVWSQVVPQGLPAVQSGWREAIVPNLSGDGGRAEPQIRSARAAITAFFQWFSDNGETLALGRCYLP